MKPRAKTRVALVNGGLSDEAYLSQRSAEVVSPALQEAGYQVEHLDWGPAEVIVRTSDAEIGRWKTIVHCLADYAPDVLFNATHGELENAGQLHGLAELAGIPLTGNALAPSVIGMDKVRSRYEFERIGVRFPLAIDVASDVRPDAASCDDLVNEGGLSFPVMIKLSHGGSSSGLEFTRTADEMAQTLASWQGRGPAYVEEFIDGREFCVTVFGRPETRLVVFPTVEVGFPGPVFDKAAKFANEYSVSLPTELDPSLDEQMQHAALRTHTAMGFSAFSRVDYRIRGAEAFALEVNTHPGLSASSIVTNSLSYAGLSIVDVVDQLVREALDPPDRYESERESVTSP